MKKEQKRYRAEEKKVAVLRRHLVDKEPRHWRTSGPLLFLQPSQPSPAVTPDPILDTARGVTQRRRSLPRGHASGREQYPVETVVIAGFLTTVDLILESQRRQRRVRNGWRLHTNMKPLFCSMPKHL